MEKNVRRLVPFEDLPDEEVVAANWTTTRLPATRNNLTTGGRAGFGDPRAGRKRSGSGRSMGDDTPFAVLSSQPRIIYDTSASSLLR